MLIYPQFRDANPLLPVAMGASWRLMVNKWLTSVEEILHPTAVSNAHAHSESISADPRALPLVRNPARS